MDLLAVTRTLGERINLEDDARLDRIDQVDDEPSISSPVIDLPDGKVPKEVGV